MARFVVLLRGVNLVKRNRVSMPQLRADLEAAGFRDVKTHLQSGNVVLSSQLEAEAVAGKVKAAVRERFGIDIEVIARSSAEMGAVVLRNPLAGVATNPRRHLVTFLAETPRQSLAADLAKLATEEKFAIEGREIYSWHPEGIGRAPLWERLGSKSIGVAATSRNWATVTALAAMANGTPAR